jgi:hypothetical protein
VGQDADEERVLGIRPDQRRLEERPVRTAEGAVEESLGVAPRGGGLHGRERRVALEQAVALWAGESKCQALVVGGHAGSRAQVADVGEAGGPVSYLTPIK